MSSTNPKISTPRAQVKVGQKIWANMVLDANALKRPSGKLSTTMGKIFKGQAVLKQAYVLKNDGNQLIVAYTTTFGNSEKETALPDIVKVPAAWYPVAPAKGAHTPLPALPSNTPAWVYLGPVISVLDDPVEVLEEFLSEDSVAKIIAQLK